MRLDVFVEPGCAFCETAASTAREIARRFPSLEVNLIDITETDTELPESIFAVPTYVLDGKVVSLGNPQVEELAALVAASERPAADAQR